MNLAMTSPSCCLTVRSIGVNYLDFSMQQLPAESVASHYVVPIPTLQLSVRSTQFHSITRNYSSRILNGTEIFGGSILRRSLPDILIRRTHSKSSQTCFWI